MAEQLLKNFSIEIEQKLYEKTIPQGQLAIYQTSTFGTLLTLNGQVVLSELDSFFYHEMMVHPALFSHLNPEKIAIVGSAFGILQEAIKHPRVQEIHCINYHHDMNEIITQYFPDIVSQQTDSRVHQQAMNASEWLLQCEAEKYDIIIQADFQENFLAEHFNHYARVLSADGILVQPCLTSLLHLKTLKPVYQNALRSGFHDWQILNFPQPSFNFGFRTIMLTTKRSVFKQVKEKEVFNRPFTTRYYNFDVHQAALVLPEFARKELEKE